MTSESARLVDFESGHFGSYKIAILVPCCNEEKSIAKVVEDFRTALPTAAILVYDNNSTDNTARVARAAGAEVFYEKRQGKGFVVRRMFADVDADIYVLVDGDATYDAPSVRPMIGRLLEKRLDMVVGTRIDREQASYRSGHRIGNKIFTAFVATVFDSKLNDVLSGYRVLSRRFVKSFPVLSGGFEIETELTIHATLPTSSSGSMGMRSSLASRWMRSIRLITLGPRDLCLNSKRGVTDSESFSLLPIYFVQSVHCRFLPALVLRWLPPQSAWQFRSLSLFLKPGWSQDYRPQFFQRALCCLRFWPLLLA